MPRCFFFVACRALLLSMVAAILERGYSFFFFLWCLMVIGNQKGALPPPTGVLQKQILDPLCLKRFGKREEKRKKEGNKTTPPKLNQTMFHRAYIDKAFTHSSDESCNRACKLLIFLTIFSCRFCVFICHLYCYVESPVDNDRIYLSLLSSFHNTARD